MIGGEYCIIFSLTKTACIYEIKCGDFLITGKRSFTGNNQTLHEVVKKSNSKAFNIESALYGNNDTCKMQIY